MSTMSSPGENKKGVVIIEGHVQGLSNTRSLGEAGIPVIVVDSNNCIARYSKYCYKFFRSPDYISSDFIDFLTDLSQKENLRGWLLLPSNDHAVYNISKNRAILEQYFSIITPDIGIIENIYDKSKLLSLAASINIPVPLTQYYYSVDEKPIPGLKFPLITRGRYGLSFYKALGKKVFLANDENELREQLTLISEKFIVPGTLTQELIPSDGTNKTISFTAFCDKGEVRTYWMGMKIREHPLRFGTATCAKSVFVRECLDYSIPLLKKLNYTGVCEIEYLLDPVSGQYKLIELNARTWLWVGLAKACGINFPVIIYDYIYGNDPSFPQNYTKEVLWINWLTDTVMMFKAILKKQMGISEYLRSLKGKKVKAIFSWKDILPGLMVLPLSFYLARKRNII